MKEVLHRLLCLVMMFLFHACLLETEPPILPDLRPASNLVINEVFTLPPSNPNWYTWIEFYNPTRDTIDLTGWTISYFTSRLQDSIVVSLDTAFSRILSFHGEFISFDTLAFLDVPFASGLLTESVRLPPSGLYTIVSNEAKLLDHTRWGPGDQRFRVEKPFVQGPVSSIDTFYSSPGVDSIVVAVKLYDYSFFIQPKEQLVLKDPSGRIVDVVRMGDSVYTNAIGDSTYADLLLGPSNRSIGTVPEFESVARYVGGYFTGNTSNDFYVTRPGLVPIPHWYSQLYKR